MEINEEEMKCIKDMYKVVRAEGMETACMYRLIQRINNE